MYEKSPECTIITPNFEGVSRYLSFVGFHNILTDTSQHSYYDIPAHLIPERDGDPDRYLEEPILIGMSL